MRIILARRMATRKRAGEACKACRIKKTKCSISRPCARCLRSQPGTCQDAAAGPKIDTSHAPGSSYISSYFTNELEESRSISSSRFANPLTAAAVLMAGPLLQTPAISTKYLQVLVCFNFHAARDPSLFLGLYEKYLKKGVSAVA